MNKPPMIPVIAPGPLPSPSRYTGGGPGGGLTWKGLARYVGKRKIATPSGWICEGSEPCRICWRVVFSTDPVY